MPVKTVLLVDDDPSIRRIGEITLHEVGKFDVRVAENGLVALDMIAQEIPDVILMDVNMPELDGVETFARIQQDYAYLPVVFMTARSDFEEPPPGAAGLIRKPFNPITLPVELRRLAEASSGN
ncbi:MAG TPA: response regulator [Planktothrix sp.]|jgi:CheY-like chemotaxis protein